MSRYIDTHKHPAGPGDMRPTALQVIKDEGLEGSMADKVFLITGCSSGIGIETARALAATGARLFLAVRSMSKGEAACGSFLKPGQVELLQLDTSSLALVRNAATEFLQRSNGRLNVLICNAGVMMIPTREQSVDGFEMQLATNYLGHFLLFWLLKDCMLRSSTPEFNSRLVNVSSSGHHESEIQFDDINFEREGGYSPNTAYGQSKLAQIYMTNYVDRHFGPLGLHALSLMPGTIFTNLQKHMPQSAIDGWRQNPDAKKFEKNDEQGAATTVVAAVAREWESQGGEYLENCSVSNTENVVHGLSGVKEYAFDERKEERLWKLTLEILGLDTEQT